MSNISNSSSDSMLPMRVDKKNFRGYTLNELRYQRAVADLKRNLVKEKLAMDVEKIQNRSIFGARPASSSKWDRVGTVASKLVGGLNYIDYITLGLSAFGAGKKVFKLLHRKKK